MKRYRQLMISIVIVGISFIFNVMLFQSMQLEKPVFLKHYYEMPLEQYTSFEIYLITNKGDERELKGILFPEITEDKYYFTVKNSNRYEMTPYHEQRRYWIEYRQNGDEQLIQEEVVLTEAIMVFSNGDKMRVPIGQIIFYPDLEGQKEVLEYTSSSASSSGEMSSNGIFTEDVTLLKIKSTLDPLVKDLVQIQVNGESPLETDFKKGTEWRMNGKIQIGDKDDRRFNCYDVQSRIYFKDTQGEVITYRVLNMRYQPYLDAKGCYQYLKKVGGIR